MNFTLPLPKWTRDRRLFLLVAVLHIYLGGGHVIDLFGPHATAMELWTDVWKGSIAWLGAYYFIALAGQAPR
jgi:hypothetical protein